MTDEYAYAEPFGPIYETPAPDACPDCSCCTRRLCAVGKLSMMGCLGRTSESDHEIRAAIADCPCDRAPTSARSICAARLEGVTDEAERRRIVEQLADNFLWTEQLQRGTV
jgi:hypothetical protein